MSPEYHEALTEILLKLEQQLMDPMIRGNREKVDALLAEDFREFGSSGRFWSRKATLDFLEAEKGYFAPAIRDFATQPISPEAALVTYRTVCTDPPGVTLRSSLWVLRAGNWRVLFHQGTKTDQPRSGQITEGARIDWKGVAAQVGGIDKNGQDQIVGTEDTDTSSKIQKRSAEIRLQLSHYSERG